MTAAAGLTAGRCLGPGEIIRRGRLADYRAVTGSAGEPHLARTDLGFPASSRGTPVAAFAHLTDLHCADVQSPARFEFFNREFADPRFRRLVPTQRSQEALTPHAIAALVAAVNECAGGPLTGRPLDLVVNSGDSIDNGQGNELVMFRRLVEGGEVLPNSGGERYEGVQAAGWPDDIFWKPDAAEGADRFATDQGFPRQHGLLERALVPFNSVGLRVRWVATDGNHEHLTQGVGVITPELELGLVGSLKPTRLDEAIDRDDVVEIFTVRPHEFLKPPQFRVTPDPARARPAASALASAGFSPERTGLGRIHDLDAVRFLLLDTVCPDGGAEGRLTVTQLEWLDAALAAAGKGGMVAVAVSHHGLESLTNRRGDPGSGPARHATGEQLLEVMHRHRCLALWLNGHVHRNRVTPRPTPGGGFWEVTTSSLIDWPCQARVIELLRDEEGSLTVASTMLDHAGPADPGSAVTSLEMASLHRQLAGNAPAGGFRSGRPGTAGDRNVLLGLGPR